MISSTIRRTLSLLTLLAAACVTLAAGAAHAGPTPEKFFFQESFSDTLTNFPCFDGIPVTMTGTVTVEGHSVENPGIHRSTHFTETIDYRVDIGDGRFLTGGVVRHFSVAFNPQRPRTTVTSTQKELATLYASDGEPLGEITLHITGHNTYTDLDGDRIPDPGEITVAFETVKVTCP